jgi:NAD(P)H-flavin reductase
MTLSDLQTAQHLPFSGKYKEWEERGVTVVPVLSKGPADWAGRAGYIQEALGT